YDFKLEGTFSTNSDTVFIIAYEPLPGKNFEGMKGQMHISSDGWAVVNIIAGSAEKGNYNVQLQQQYEQVDGRWFPVQEHTEYDFNMMVQHGYKPMAFSRSYYTNINLNPDLKRRDFKAVTIKMQPGAARQTDAFWNLYRPDSLDFRERNTYRFVDSLGREFKMDARLRVMEAIYSNQIPVGPVSIDLYRL